MYLYIVYTVIINNRILFTSTIKYQYNITAAVDSCVVFMINSTWYQGFPLLWRHINIHTYIRDTYLVPGIYFQSAVVPWVATR